MSALSGNHSDIIEPKRNPFWVVVLVLRVGALVAYAYNHFVTGDSTQDNVSLPTVSVTPPPAVSLTPTSTPTSIEYSDQDTARDLCWGDSLPGVQTSVPSGMNVYDGLGKDEGMRICICMTPGEYTRYQAAFARQLAAEEEVRRFVGQYTADDATKSIRAAAAVAYLCGLDDSSDQQRSAARVVFAELAGQGVSFSATRDAMCGNRSQPTPPPPHCEGKKCQTVPAPTMPADPE